MPTLMLPRARRGTLRAVWLVASCAGGVAAGFVTAAVRRDLKSVAVAVPVAGVIALPGLRHPERTRGAYEAWDRAGAWTSRRATSWLTEVGFAATLATRNLGERNDLPLRSDGGTAWRARSSQPNETYRYQDSRDVASRGDAFDRYAEQPGHEWVDAIRPVVRLIAAVESMARATEQPPSDVYTLY